ncbi:DUF2589 domain-containing protein [Oscillatoriales cyanobacterium LEGE 11467]|uniref:DUF2589 domain-containing protein n=1 Tax=Zarconia navalis LEGE 11467 TaxID=1828826 RepID=A0A928VXS6_9CYAN|nr:DUF2589 domain-containing protein [Zarconia navalis]MBE9042162.1 DUF2589 domain-containing protein [Zarconia navalis LEGE 11467]
MSAAQGKELSSLDFGAMIGGPLTAVVKAQAQSALASAQFIKEVGFEHDKKGKITKAMNVEFTYEKPVPGKEPGTTTKQKASLSVPILTILPIPFIQVDSAEIAFHAKLLSVTHNELKVTDKGGGEANVGFAGFSWLSSAQMKANYSHQSKRRESGEIHDTYGLDVTVKASQAEMPAGMDKMLNILEALVEETTAGSEDDDNPKSAVAIEANYTSSTTTVTITPDGGSSEFGTEKKTVSILDKSNAEMITPQSDVTWQDNQITVVQSLDSGTYTVKLTVPGHKESTCNLTVTS